MGLKLEKARKRKRQGVSGNQWEKDEEEDMKKEGNISRGQTKGINLPVSKKLYLVSLNYYLKEKKWSKVKK